MAGDPQPSLPLPDERVIAEVFVEFGPECVAKLRALEDDPMIRVLGMTAAPGGWRLLLPKS